MTRTYRVGGMTCGGCARSVENAIKAAVPGARVTVDLGQGQVTVEPSGDDEAVEKAVSDAGFSFGGTA